MRRFDYASCVHRDICNAVNKRALRLGVRLAIEPMFTRQLSLQYFVFRRHVRMRSQVVAKGNWSEPLRCVDRDEMEMMRAASDGLQNQCSSSTWYSE